MAPTIQTHKQPKKAFTVHLQSMPSCCLSVYLFTLNLFAAPRLPMYAIPCLAPLTLYRRMPGHYRRAR